MKLITHKTNRDSHWAQIDLTCLEDPRLSPLAKCLHIYAMTRPPEWELRTEDMVRRFNASRRTVQRALRELEQHGYLQRERMHAKHGDGRHSLGEFVLTWHDEPTQTVQTLDQSLCAKSVLIQSVPQQAVPEQTEPVQNDAHTDNQYTNHQENRKQERERVEGYSAEFREFLSVYPVKYDKLTAWRFWNQRLNEGIRPEEMILAAKHYRDYQKAIGTTRRYLMAAYTFLGSRAKIMDWIEEREVEDDGRYERRGTGGRNGIGGISEEDRELYRQAVLRGGAR